MVTAAATTCLAVAGTGWAGADERGGSLGAGLVTDRPLLAPPNPTTTLPGYSDGDLRDVVDALVALAGGHATAPTAGGPPARAATTPGASAPDGAPEHSPAPRPGGRHWRVLLYLAAVAAAAVAAVFVRRVRGRRHGRTAPVLPAGHGVAVAAVPLGPAERTDLALRLANASEALPDVVVVRVGRVGVELLLDPPAPRAAAPFVASDDGHQWRLGPDVADDVLRGAAATPAPLPSLVTVGDTEEGAVLVDVLAAGTLSVEGDPHRVAALLEGAALELATAPWANGLTVLAGEKDRFKTPEQGPAGASPGRARRPSGDDVKRTESVVVVPAGDGAAAAVEALADPWRRRGAGLLAAGPVPEAAWRLVIAPGGDAVLHPLGMELRCSVDAAAVRRAAGTLGPAVSAGRPVAGSPFGVEVLGPVRVRWPDRTGRRGPNRRKLDELVAYLATHPERPVPAERLRTAAWPLADDERAGEVSDATFRAAISRARAALGNDGEGRPLLPDSEDGCYRLSPAFACDWVAFAELARRSRSAPGDEAVDLLRDALAMVRGAPFADTPRDGYGWAWSEQLVSAIEVAVADAAERLAALALERGDAACARWAAEQGLLALPTREGLYRARMRAAFEAGDADGVEQAWAEVRRAARSVGVTEEPQVETTALYHRLLRIMRPSPTGSTDQTLGAAT